MDLLAVLVSDDGSSSSSGIGSEDDSVLNLDKIKLKNHIELTLKTTPQIVVPVFIVLILFPGFESASALFLRQLS